jgi:hypothetical protein
LRIAKKKDLEGRLEKNKKNPRGTWEILNEFTGKKV